MTSYHDENIIETYEYDALSNRISKDVNGVRKAGYRYNALNQMTERVEDGIQHSYRYDGRGNLKEEKCGDSLVRQYLYDATGCITLGKNLENGEKTEYTYNALYQRVKDIQTRQNHKGNYPEPAKAETELYVKRETDYVIDFLSDTHNELMTYEKGNSCGSSHSSGGVSRTSQSGVPQNGNGNGFDYLGFAKALIQGAAIGGVSSAAFYGEGKAVEKLVESMHRTPKVYMTGEEGKTELARMFGGESQAYFKTSRGKRFVDQYAKGVAHESKVGYTSLNQRIKTQILKDVELINTGQVTGAHWHFFTSGVTGKGGASQPLLDFLVNNGIKYTIY